MGLYEGIKDVAKVIQKADNIDLYKQLIELSAQALEMQNEITRLSAENTELKRMKDIEGRIERHQAPFITIKDDQNSILYCAHCWDYEKKLIQVKNYDTGAFKCTHCENNGIYDQSKNEEHRQRERESFAKFRERPGKNFW